MYSFAEKLREMWKRRNRCTVIVVNGTRPTSDCRIINCNDEEEKYEADLQDEMMWRPLFCFLQTMQTAKRKGHNFLSDTLEWSHGRSSYQLWLLFCKFWFDSQAVELVDSCFCVCGIEPYSRPNPWAWLSGVGLECVGLCVYGYARQQSPFEIQSTDVKCVRWLLLWCPGKNLTSVWGYLESKICPQPTAESQIAPISACLGQHDVSCPWCHVSCVVCLVACVWWMLDGEWIGLDCKLTQSRGMIGVCYTTTSIVIHSESVIKLNRWNVECVAK